MDTAPAWQQVMAQTAIRGDIPMFPGRTQAAQVASICTGSVTNLDVSEMGLYLGSYLLW